MILQSLNILKDWHSHQTHCLTEYKLNRLLCICRGDDKSFHMYVFFYVSVFFFHEKKNLTSEWSSLIFIMAGPLSWLPDLLCQCRPQELSVNMVLTMQAPMPASADAITWHTKSRTSNHGHGPNHGCNYQSASQPSNWGIHLNSVKWHFSDRGSSCSRLWIIVIPEELSSFQSSQLT